jgi:glycosyltransferase involved in cell wall biosynthesis
MKTILYSGPETDLTVGARGAGGYIRNVSLMMNHFHSERYTLRHVPTTVRKVTDSAWTKVPRMLTELKRMSAATPGASGAHFLAQYRAALPRELILSALCRRRNIPYVYHLHAGAFIPAFEALSVPMRVACQRMLRDAGVLLCEGEVYVSWLRDRLELDSVWLPNFVAADEVPHDVPVPFSGDVLRLIYVGYCYEPKGVFLLVEGARMAAAQGLPVHVTLVGKEAPDFGAWLDEVEPTLDGLPMTLERRGVLPHSEALSLYASHDAFVMPTAHPGEGHPNSVNEAMMARCTIVATRHGFLPSVLDGVGSFLEERSADAVRDALIGLWADKEGARVLADAGRERVLERFHGDRIFPIIEDAYDRLTAPS